MEHKKKKMLETQRGIKKNVLNGGWRGWKSLYEYYERKKLWKRIEYPSVYTVQINRTVQMKS